VAVFLLVVVGVLPIGMRGYLFGLTVEQARAENQELREAGDALRDEARAQAVRLEGQLDRARRLSWVLGVSEAVWRREVPSPSSVWSDDDSVVSGLASCLERLEELERELLVADRQTPYPLASLPTASPLLLSRAVPVDMFGWRISAFTGKEEAHHGVTLAAAVGEPVRAPGAGTVAFTGAVRDRRSNEWMRYGNLVVIAHGGGVYSVLGHLQSVSVRRGQSVGRGAAVGFVGTTGWSRVPALYFEIRWPWQGVSRPVDPALFQLWLALRDVDARLLAPDGGLPDDHARLERLPGFRG
jgi:murein DD-endopeptidase MepM/ murein hydrolase activator NlpD